MDAKDIVPDPRDVFEERLDFLAARKELDKLPGRLRAVVVIHSQVRRHADVAEILGVSRQRVAYLLQQVGVAVRELAERRLEAGRPVASPRPARLRELALRRRAQAPRPAGQHARMAQLLSGADVDPYPRVGGGFG